MLSQRKFENSYSFGTGKGCCVSSWCVILWNAVCYVWCMESCYIRICQCRDRLWPGPGVLGVQPLASPYCLNRLWCLSRQRLGVYTAQIRYRRKSSYLTSVGWRKSILINPGKHLPADKAWHPRRLEYLLLDYCVTVFVISWNLLC